MKRASVVFCLTLSSIGIAACEKEREEPMTPAAQAGTPTMDETTQSQASQSKSGVTDSQRSAKVIAAARCEREVRCNNVGADGAFASQEECVASVEPATRSQLEARQCPAGVEQVELDECVEEVRDQDCTSTTGSIELVAECSTSELCLD
jgi:hypothetical protein